jgi:hypothetical protein
MSIPEHVKRQAMDAVSHKETTAMIRAFQGSGASVSTRYDFTHAKAPQPEVSPIPDDVKRQAKDAISHPETQAQIRLVKNSGEITTPLTPNRDTERIAGKVAQMQKSGQDMDATHKAMTKDNFGREYG